MENKPYIVAGPCSVESRGQLKSVVEALCRLPQVEMVRCGVWKPRTHPGGFEGLGEKALTWMEELKDEYPEVRFCCEVARPDHVELALRHGVDAIWIGARTTANPFMVQEITEALRGSSVSMMVKNAPSPDVDLWIGAIERCRKVGIIDIKAIHRGFELFRNSGYRNTPLWEVPIELRRRMPEIPILCDPSHIAGRREGIGELSQTALDLGFDGLMVEVHPAPDEALTDARQQVTPAALEAILSRLVIRQLDSPSSDMQLSLLRGQIDNIDCQLLHLLMERFEVVRQIADVKKQSNMALFQPKRWDSLLQGHLAAGAELGLSEAFVRGIFEKIHTESIRVQREQQGGESTT